MNWGVCIKGSDNIHFGFPPIMSDGRNYSSWQPNAEMNNEIIKTYNIKTNSDYRAFLTKNADIIVMALGIPEYLTADMVKEGATVIDVGITRVADKNHPKGYVIKGDVLYDDVSTKASAITPVPGGVGPMTIAMLLKNTLLAFQRKN